MIQANTLMMFQEVQNAAVMVEQFQDGDTMIATLKQAKIFPCLSRQIMRLLLWLQLLMMFSNVQSIKKVNSFSSYFSFLRYAKK